jgi:hypothetical protein
VHDAQHPEADAPALGKESTWFPQDKASGSAARAEAAGAESSDDEIEIQREVKDLKCPLTLMTFRHPYTNTVCNHSFEKEAIVEYHGKSALMREGVRVVKCPAVGCENVCFTFFFLIWFARYRDGFYLMFYRFLFPFYPYFHALPFLYPSPNQLSHNPYQQS